jgi:aryl-alcohol dehydrogenase-like predicted oxidoreductase
MRLRQSRDRVIISTKGGHPSIPDWARRITEADIRADMEDSLRYLGTDHVDIYFLHRDDESKSVEAIMPILDALVREGKTRLIGASNWTVARINEANAFARENGMAEFSVSQIFHNAAVINKEGVYDPTLVAMDPTEHEGYEVNGLPVMAYTSQAQGLFSHIRHKGYGGLSEGMTRTYVNPTTQERAARILAVAAETGISPTAVSLAYLLRDRRVKTFPILGISRVERLEEAMGVFSLGEKDITRLFVGC